MAKGKGKKLNIVPKRIIKPAHLVNQQQQKNIIQVIEIHPEKKYVLQINDEFKKVIANNVIRKFDPEQFRDRGSEFAKRIISEAVDNAIQKFVNALVKQLNWFYKEPDTPFWLVHLEGNDYIKIVSEVLKYDDEEKFDVEIEEDE